MRYLFAHAHPDDETLASGVLIAHLLDEGHEVYVLTATRGEQGEVVDGPLAHLEGTPELVAHRERELAAALEALGVTGAMWLGAPERVYRDSGMVWVRPGLAGPADEADPLALSVAPIGDVVADLVRQAREVSPDIIVSYDADGGYGHPDHIRMHEASVLAAREIGFPFAALTYSPGRGVEWFELERYRDRAVAALRHHASQLRLSDGDVVHSGGQREPIIVDVGLRS